VWSREGLASLALKPNPRELTTELVLENPALPGLLVLLRTLLALRVTPRGEREEEEVGGEDGSMEDRLVLRA